MFFVFTARWLSGQSGGLRSKRFKTRQVAPGKASGVKHTPNEHADRGPLWRPLISRKRYSSFLTKMTLVTRLVVSSWNCMKGHIEILQMEQCVRPSEYLYKII